MKTSILSSTIKNPTNRRVDNNNWETDQLREAYRIWKAVLHADADEAAPSCTREQRRYEHACWHTQTCCHHWHHEVQHEEHNQWHYIVRACNKDFRQFNNNSFKEFPLIPLIFSFKLLYKRLTCSRKTLWLSYICKKKLCIVLKFAWKRFQTDDLTTGLVSSFDSHDIREIKTTFKLKEIISSKQSKTPNNS